MLIIGITGKKRVGKNYVADLATKELEAIGLKVKQLAFAEPLKNICKELFFITDEDLAGDKTGLTGEWKTGLAHQMRDAVGYGDVRPLTVRQLLQLVGTDLFRECWSQTIWTRHMGRRLTNAKAEGVDVAIITDCRFENEAETVRAAGGCMVHVKGPNRGADGKAEDATAAHVSEAGIKAHMEDYEIYNGTAGEAKMAVPAMLSALLKKPGV